jgi:hypothetical protein
MTEQQRREQISQARRQAEQNRNAAPAMSDAEAQAIVSENQGLTQEQVVAIAMFGKFVQNDITGVKKSSLGDLKVTDVDMSKVMPSGIARAMNLQPAPAPRPQPVAPPPPVVAALIEPLLNIVAPPPPQGAVNLPLIIAPTAPAVDNDQQYFDFDRKARYEDIMKAIDNLENKIIILTNKIDEISTFVDKKKLKKTIIDGPQTG